LFVDDLPSNLRGARAVGMHTEHFDVTDPVGSTARMLRRVGIVDGQRAPRSFRLTDGSDRTDGTGQSDPGPIACPY
jgi:putative hydrolase of the HAD superfamily